MKNIDDLKKKYWKGTSDLNEEQELRKHFSESENTHLSDEYFNYLEFKRNETLNVPDFEDKVLLQIRSKQEVQSPLFRKINWQIAAAVTLLFTASALFFIRQTDRGNTNTSSNQLALTDTYQDPEKAFEETKKALLLISEKLNKGNAYTTEFVKFSTTQDNLKKEN